MKPSTILAVTRLKTTVACLRRIRHLNIRVHNWVSNCQIPEYPVSIFTCFEYRIFGNPVSKIGNAVSEIDLKKTNIGFSKSTISDIGKYPFKGPNIPSLTSPHLLKIPRKWLKLSNLRKQLSFQSSLLHTILGNMRVTGGKTSRSSSVAYVSQESWIFSATVRENILLGETYDATLYTECVNATGLYTVSISKGPVII